MTCSGTSMSTPHVAGVGALLAQASDLRGDTFDPVATEATLEDTSEGIGGFRQVQSMSALLFQATNYTYNNTDMSVSKDNSGKVQFRSQQDPARMGQCFAFSSNNITLDAANANCTQYNNTATIELTNLTFGIAVPKRNGVACEEPQCQNVSFADGTLTFDVLGFSSYTAGLGVNLSISDETDTVVKFPSDQVDFLANFTNSTGAANFTDGACQISLNSTGTYGSLQNMIYNSTSELFELNSTFNNALNGTFNVTCTSFGETLSTIDNFTISTDSIAPNVTNLAPSNNTEWNTSSTVVFNYTVSDNSTIVNCSLYTNGTLKQTKTDIVRGANENLNASLTNGVYSWMVSCNDGSSNNANSSTWLVDVQVTNSPPVFIANISNQSWAEDTVHTINLTPIFNDTSDDTLGYTAQVSTNFTVVIDNSTTLVNITPAANFTGFGNIVFTAHDSLGQTNVSNNVTLNVTPVNDEPKFSGTISSQSWNKGSDKNNAFDLDDYFSDVDNTTLTYGYNGTSTINVSIDGSNVVSFDSGSTFTGTEYVQFNATDGTNTTISNTITLTVSTPSTSGGGGGGGGGCVNSCSTPGFISCSGSKSELLCGNYDADSCYETITAACLEGQHCVSGSGCVPCSEEWLCDDWQACDGGNQMRTCTEINGCGTFNNRPEEVRTCVEAPEILSIDSAPEATAAVTGNAAEDVNVTYEDSNTCGDGVCSAGEFCPEDCSKQIRKGLLVVLSFGMGGYALFRWNSFFKK
jgi:hypothetical protein